MPRDTHNITASRSTEWLFEVSRGRVPGHRVVVINSFLPVLNTADGFIDVWTGLGELSYLDSAELMNISSTSALDVAVTGDGCRTALITGRDADYNIIGEELPMSGTGTVQTLKKYLRVMSIVNTTDGVSDTNIGDITVTSEGSGVLQCHCKAAATQSQNSQYTVPLGKSLIPVQLMVNVTRTIGGSNPCVLLRLESHIQLLGQNRALRQLLEARIDATMGNFPAMVFPVRNPLPEKSDFRFIASTDTNSTEVRLELCGVEYSADIA